MTFFKTVDIELKRAERYSVFLSILVFDLTYLQTVYGSSTSDVIGQLCKIIESNARIVDSVEVVSPRKIALLFPETSRQGAEIAGKRIRSLIRDYLADQVKIADRAIPAEMASFPDAAGARTIAQMLKEYSDTARN